LKRSLLLFLRYVPLLGLAVVLAAQAGHITAFTGVWKLNLAKSTFNPGPSFKSFTLTFTPDGVRHLDLLDGDGKSHQISLPWSDGKEVTPVGGGMEYARVVSKIQGKTVDDTWKRNGTIIERVHGAVSPDGRTLTMNVEGPGSTGGTFRNRVVFDKQ
jgi:hypothetical protein